MAWLSENWIWVIFGVAFIAMHMFGHGGHGGHGGGGSGGHGGHGGKEGAKNPEKERVGAASPTVSNDTGNAHRH